MCGSALSGFLLVTRTGLYFRAILLTRFIQKNRSMTDSYDSADAMIVRPCFLASLFLLATVATGAAISHSSSAVSRTDSSSRGVSSFSSKCRKRTRYR
jgi:hypothetical protein